MDYISEIAHNLISHYNWLKERGLDDPDIVIEELPDPVTRIKGKNYISFCSNNYLGLSKRPEVIEKAVEALKRHGIGTCESRRLGGNLDLLEEVEETIAWYKGTEDAILFATGMMTNLGVISAISDVDFYMKLFYEKSEGKKRPIIISDEKNHRSIQMGIKLARAECEKYRHCDTDHLTALLEKHRDKMAFIISDSIFSMDGNLAPLPDIVEIARHYRAAIMIDDAHGSGVWGPRGRGIADHFGVSADIEFTMGTLSKAFGGLGGFVAARADIVNMLKINTSTYYFTSSLPADEAAGLIEAIRIADREPALRKNLWQQTVYFTDSMLALGFSLPHRYSQIIPVMIGNERTAFRFEEELENRGILCSAVGVPAVKRGTERVRVTINATHTREQIDTLIESMKDIARLLNFPLNPISPEEKIAMRDNIPDYIEAYIES